jgi:hypothetical protein
VRARCMLAESALIAGSARARQPTRRRRPRPKGARQAPAHQGAAGPVKMSSVSSPSALRRDVEHKVCAPLARPRTGRRTGCLDGLSPALVRNSSKEKKAGSSMGAAWSLRARPHHSSAFAALFRNPNRGTRVVHASTHRIIHNDILRLESWSRRRDMLRPAAPPPDSRRPWWVKGHG